MENGSRVIQNLIRSAHPPTAENTGTLESWNGGFKKNRIQNTYYCIDSLVLVEYLLGKKQKIAAW